MTIMERSDYTDQLGMLEKHMFIAVMNYNLYTVKSKSSSKSLNTRTNSKTKIPNTIEYTKRGQTCKQ